MTNVGGDPELLRVLTEDYSELEQNSKVSDSIDPAQKPDE
jgi:hypothetical protein